MSRRATKRQARALRRSGLRVGDLVVWWGSHRDCWWRIDAIDGPRRLVISREHLPEEQHTVARPECDAVVPW